jgi:hypothetical protein
MNLSRQRNTIMRNILFARAITVVFAAGLRFTPVNCAYAADDVSTAKSLGETVPNRDEGLVGYWNFDEGKGDATKDSSKYGNDGKITGTQWAKGVLGSALQFNGVSDYVNMRSPRSGSHDKAVSVEAWIQSTGNNGNANLVFAGPECHGFGIWIQSGRVFGGLWNSEGTQFNAISSSSPTPEQWCHVAMTCDMDIGKVVRLYINGKLDSTSAATGTAIRSGYATIDIGGRMPNQWYFNGLIDEVKIYNRALSEVEIRNSYNDDMKKRADALNTAGYKNSPWIGATNRGQQTAYFRKSFKVPELSGKKVYLICDGAHYQVFLNGKAIIPFKSYFEAQMVDISKELKTGKNVIAAQATNMGSTIGLFTCIGYPSKESPGGYEILASGEGMKCSTQAVKDWNLRDFDDSTWTQSTKMADFDKGLALKRNFPNLGLYLNDVHTFEPPKCEDGQTMQLTDKGLTLVVQYTKNKHSFHVIDSVTHEKWFMPGPPFLIDESVSAWDGSVSCEKRDKGFKFTAFGFDKYPGFKISYTLLLKDRALDISLDPIRFPADKQSLSVSFPLNFGAAQAGEEGYLVNSYGNYDAREGRMFPFGMDVDRYKDSGGLDIRGESTLPFFGIVRQGHPCVAIITDFPAVDYEFKTLIRQNCNGFKHLYATTPIWSYEADRVNEPRHITYQFLEKGGYVEIAKAYRQFLVSTGRYVTLKERVKQRPICNLNVNASSFWGAYSLKEMPDFMAKLKEAGVEKAVLHVANRNDFVGGWKRWPEGMTTLSSTAEEFKHVSEVARKTGYGFSPVDEYTPLADRGSDYDASLRAMRRDGSYHSFEKENTFFLCESLKLRFAQRDLPRVKEVTGECPYLLDCEGCTMYECFDPRHPLTSRQQIFARREVLTYIRNTMGCVVSEGSPIDWLTDIIDVGHGHSIGFPYWESKPGVFIPLWSLVYAGAVIDLFNNQPVAEDGMLYAALYGLNARFNAYTFGKTELEWHKRISDAWPRRNFYELTDHTFLTPLVQKSQFKENSMIVDVIANFGDTEYLYEKQVIPPHDFKTFVGGH